MPQESAFQVARRLRYGEEQAQQALPTVPAAPPLVPQAGPRSAFQAARAALAAKPLTFGDAFSETFQGGKWKERLPFFGGAVTADKYAELWQASSRLEQGSQTRDDEELLLAFLSEAQRPQGIGYMVGNILLDLPAFAVEFWVSGGLLSAAKKGGLKLAGKGLREAIEKGAAKRGLKVLGEKVAAREFGQAAGVAARSLAATGVEAVAQTAILSGIGEAAGGSRVRAGAWRRALPELNLSEDDAGRLAITFGSAVGDFYEELPDAMKDELIEIFSEKTGEGLVAGMKRIPGIGYVTALQADFVDWLTRKYPGRLGSLLTDVAKGTGFHGMVGEWAEERLGGALRGATGVDKGGVLANAFPGLEQQAAELIAFGVPGAVGVGGRVLTSPGAPVELPEKGYAKAAQPARAMTEADRDRFVEEFRGKAADAAAAQGKEVPEIEVVPAEEVAALPMDKRGMDRVYVRSKTGEPLPIAGEFVREGVAIVDVNAIQGRAEVESHEISHNLEETNPGVWDEFVDDLSDVDADSLEDTVKGYQADYKAATGLDLTDLDAIASEGVARYMEERAGLIWIASTKEGRQAFADAIGNRRSFVQAVRDWLADGLKYLGVTVRKTQEKRLAELDLFLSKPEGSTRVEHLRGALLAAEAIDTMVGLTVPSERIPLLPAHSPFLALAEKAGPLGEAGPAVTVTNVVPPKGQSGMPATPPVSAQVGAGGEPAPVVSPGAPAASRVTPAREVKRIASALREGASKQTRYQGNKREALKKLATKLAQFLGGVSPETRTVFDFYAGGGTYGLTLAAAMPGVDRVVLNEFDPVRRRRLELAFERGAAILDPWESNALLKRIWAEASQLATERGATPVGDALEAVAGAEKPSKEAFYKYRAQMKAAPEEVQVAFKTVLDALFSAARTGTPERIMRTAREDADRIKRAHDLVVSQGKRVEVISVDARSAEAVAMTQKGGPALVVLDPPYYLTASGTYSGPNGVKIDFKSPEFLADNAAAAARMAPGNAVLYHNSEHADVRKSLDGAFNGNIELSSWERSPGWTNKKTGKVRAPARETLGLYDGTRQGRDAGGRVRAGEAAAEARGAGGQRGVLAGARADAGGPADAGSDRADRGDGARGSGAERLTPRQRRRAEKKARIAEKRGWRDLAAEKTRIARADIRREKRREFFEQAQQMRPAAETRAERAARMFDEGDEDVARYAVPGFHGSPYEFDRFSTDKIGTGEGAQAYGWGLYFASKKQIAEHYKKTLSRLSRAHTTWDGRRLTKDQMRSWWSSDDPTERWMSTWLADKISPTSKVDQRPKLDARLADLKEQKSDLQARLDKRRANPPIAATWTEQDYIDRINGLEREIAYTKQAKSRLGFVEEKSSGAGYEVELAPEEDEYLLWDEPLSKQSEKVRDAAQALWRAGEVRYGHTVETLPSLDFMDQQGTTGRQFYSNVSGYEGSPRAASLAFLSSGIRGIKYLDGSSRSKGEGSYNYVLFDDADVKITGRFAVAPRTDSPAFKRWFRDSKVVDEQGKPLVVYHGAGAAFNAFEVPAFFTSNARGASSYAQMKGQRAPQVYPVYLSIQNPASERDIQQAAIRIGVDVEEDLSTFELITPSQHSDAQRVVAELSRLGFDGAYIETDFAVDAVDEDGIISSWVAFRPEQIKSAIGNRGTYDPTNPDIRYAVPPADQLGFYSGARAAFEATQQGSFKAAAVRPALKKYGAKDEELDWMGLDEWLRSLKGRRVTREELDVWLRENEVVIGERVLGGHNPSFDDLAKEWYGARVAELTEDQYQEFNARVRELKPVGAARYEKYSEPGGEGYRELLLTLPGKHALGQPPDQLLGFIPEGQVADVLGDVMSLQPTWSSGEPITDERLAEIARAFKSDPTISTLRREGLPSASAQEAMDILTEIAKADSVGYFYGTHFGDEPNIIVHVRFNERVDAEGNRVLFIEEVQSDWHQKGRKKGYLVPGGVADAPFKQSWPTLAMKRMIRWAAENGFDKIAWTPGAVQVKRYEDSTRAVADSIHWNRPPGDDGIYVWATRGVQKVWSGSFDVRGVEENGNTVEDYLGKQLAQRILSEPEGSVEGDSITIGGKGMLDFYDRRLVETASKLGKRFGAKVSDSLVQMGKHGQLQHLKFRASKLRLELVELRALPEVSPGQRALFNAPLSEYTPERISARRAKHAKRIADKEAQLAEAERLLADALERGRQDSVHSLPITPSMRESVVQTGQPRFAVPRKRHRQFAGFDIGDERTFWGIPVDRWIRGMADKELRVLRFEQALGQALERTLSDDESVYRAIERMPGKVASSIRRWEQRYLDPLKKLMKEAGITREELDEYLYAMHAEERDRWVRRQWHREYKRAKTESKREEVLRKLEGNENPSGLPTKERERILAAVAAKENADAYAKAAKLVWAMNANTRRVMRFAGLISQKTFDAWTEQYQRYVPLRTSFEDERSGTGRGLSIAGPEVRKVNGRWTLAHSPLTYSMLQAQRAYVRGHKNEVGNAFLALVEKYGDLLKMQVREEPEEHDTELGELLPQAPLPTPYEFSTKVQGKQIYITVSDALLRRAMQGLGEQDMGPFVRFLAWVNRGLSNLNTSWDPDFVLSNFVRDIQTAGINLGGERSMATAARVLAFTLSGKPQMAVHRGLKGQENPADEWLTAFHRLDRAGGLTAWYHVRDFRAEAKAIDRELAGLTANPLAQVRRTLGFVAEKLEDVNRAIENGVRLAAFKVALEEGATEKQAASLAKNLTVNFNRRGEWGAAINAFYLFYNASVQGSMRMFSALRRPGVQRLALSVAVASALLDAWNRSAGGDDDDGIPFYDKIPEWVKQRNLIVMSTDGSGDYIKVPLPYGYNVFHAIGQKLSALRAGAATLSEIAMQLVATVADSFNPLGSGGSLAQFLSPTLLDPVVQLSENQTFYGAPIRPDAFDDATTPSSQLYWSSVSPAAKKVAEELNRLTGGDRVVSGGVDVSPEDLEHVFEFASGGLGRLVSRIDKVVGAVRGGEDLPIKDTPIVRRFLGEKSETFDRQAYIEQRDDVRRAEKQLQEYAGEPAETARLRSGRAKQISLIPAMRAAETRLRKLRKLRRSAEEAGDKERVRSIEDAMSQVQAAFSRRYREALAK